MPSPLPQPDLQQVRALQSTCRKADRALEADIKERVLSWVDCIVRRGTHSAILPIALLPSNMSTEEEARRESDRIQRKANIHILFGLTEEKTVEKAMHDIQSP